MRYNCICIDSDSFMWFLSFKSRFGIFKSQRKNRLLSGTSSSFDLSCWLRLLRMYFNTREYFAKSYRPITTWISQVFPEGWIWVLSKNRLTELLTLSISALLRINKLLPDTVMMTNNKTQQKGGHQQPRAKQSQWQLCASCELCAHTFTFFSQMGLGKLYRKLSFSRIS